MFSFRCISDNDSDLVFHLIFYGREIAAPMETLTGTSDARLVHLELPDNSVVQVLILSRSSKYLSLGNVEQSKKSDTNSN